MLKLRHLPVLIVLVASVLRAEGPASQPAADLQATPKATLKTFASATRQADAAKLRACLYAASALEDKMAGAMVDMIVAVARLRLAAVEKYGVMNARDLEGDIPTEADINRIDLGEEKIEGNQAVVIMKEPTQSGPMRLLKVDGVWKVPVGPSIAGQKPAAVEAQIAQMRSTAAATSEVAQDITAGKYATAKEAVAALQNKIRSQKR